MMLQNPVKGGIQSDTDSLFLSTCFCFYEIARPLVYFCLKRPMTITSSEPDRDEPAWRVSSSCPFPRLYTDRRDTERVFPPCGTERDGLAWMGYGSSGSNDCIGRKTA